MKRFTSMLLILVTAPALAVSVIQLLARQAPPPIDPAVLARVATAPPLTIEQVNKWETELSNWGKWGPDDERGSLNYVTPEKTLEALKLAKDGVVVSLAHFAGLEKAADNFNFGETKHWMWRIDPQTGQPRGALDGITGGTASNFNALGIF